MMVALADQPLINEQDITSLISAYKRRGDKTMVVPRVTTADGNREPGNPVIFDAKLREQWLAGAADLACRKWRDTNPERILWFDSDNRRYRIDIDTPEDLERFTASTGHTLTWPQSFARRLSTPTRP